MSVLSLNVWSELQSGSEPNLRKALFLYSGSNPMSIFVTEVAGVTFSDSDSAPVPTFQNPDPCPAIFQVWEFDSCSDSGYNHRSNRNLPMFLLKKWPHRHLLLPKLKSEPGSGSESKTQNPVGVDSGTSDPVPPLLCNRHVNRPRQLMM